jgi:hypothetical protein
MASAFALIAGDVERRSNEVVPLRNDVGRQLIFDIGNAVAELQFSLFEALDLNKVRPRRFLQRRNRGIEVAMLLLQARKLCPKLAFFLFRHHRLDRGPAVWAQVASRLTPGDSPK